MASLQASEPAKRAIGDLAATPVAWSRSGLETVGFEGFIPLVGIEPAQIPEAHGVYVLLRTSTAAPVPLADNPVRRPRLKLYTVEYLGAHWVEGTEVLYIGKAAGAAGLRDRLTSYSKMSSSHSGGRAVWQLADADGIFVCWKTLENPREVEARLIVAFKTALNGLRPFANWTN